MPGKRLTPAQVTEAATLRAAGYTLTVISERLDVSVSSLQRAFKRHSIRKGALHVEAIDRASQELLERVTSSDRVKEEAARLVADDLAHTRLIREKAAVALEALGSSDTSEAALTMRALVAYSSLLKNTTDTLRHGLGLNRQGIFESLEDPPDLIIHEMTAAEIEEAQNKSKDGLV